MIYLLQEYKLTIISYHYLRWIRNYKFFFLFIFLYFCDDQKISFYYKLLLIFRRDLNISNSRIKNELFLWYGWDEGEDVGRRWKPVIWSLLGPPFVFWFDHFLGAGLRSNPIWLFGLLPDELLCAVSGSAKASN